jgi:subtilisin family serine protease
VHHRPVLPPAAFLVLALCAILMLMLTPGLAHAQTAEAAPVEPVPPGEEQAPGEYIVQLKASAGPDEKGTAERLANANSATVGPVFETAVKGFGLENATPQEAAALAEDPAVEAVYPNLKVTTQGTQRPAPWHLDRIDQRSPAGNQTYRFADRANGEGVHLYVIDTGVNIAHQEFEGRATRDLDTTQGPPLEACPAAPEGGIEDHGHGTHVAGIAGGRTYGVAKKVSIHDVRVLGCDGSGTFADVIAGIDWVTLNHQKPAIANLSLGATAPAGFDILDIVVKRSIQAGVTYAIAAGNGGDDGVGDDAAGDTPARVAEALTVGATAQGDARARFSNFGAGVDLFAPGVAVDSAWVGSTFALQRLNGTSMAAPVVAGIAARYLQVNPAALPSLTARTVVSQATANAVGDPGPGTTASLAYTSSNNAPRANFRSVTATTVRGWADDRSCAAPVTVKLTADPPGDAPPAEVATLTADQSIFSDVGPHGFTFTHSLPAGTVLTGTVKGFNGNCEPDGNNRPLGGSRAVPGAGATGKATSAVRPEAAQRGADLAVGTPEAGQSAALLAP